MATSNEKEQSVKRLEEATLIRHPSYQIIRCNSDEVVIRFGSRSRSAHTLLDEKRRGILADLLVHLSTPKMLVDLSNRFPPDDVIELVDQLVKARIVVDVESAESSLLHLGLESPASGLNQAEIGIVGNGRIATAITANLLDLGVGTIVAVDGSSFEDSRVVVDAPDLNDLFVDAEIVVVATDEPDLAALYRLNSMAIEHETPWVMTHADGPELIIGPLFRPGQTACFNDYDIQEEAGRTYRMEHLVYKSVLAEKGFSPRLIPRMSAEHAAALATQGIVEALVGSGSYLDGTVVRVDIERLEVIREQVVRLPRCPACLGLNNDYRHPFL